MGSIDVLGGSSLRAGISPNSQADGAQPGDITLKATGTLNIQNSSIYNAAFGAGNGGNLLIDTGKLIVSKGARLATTTVGRKGGELMVNAAESVELSGTSDNGFPSFLTSATRGSGDASPLTINTKRLIVSGGAIISAGTTSSGKGGELTINATESVELIGTSKTNLPASDLQSVLGVDTAKVFTEGLTPSGVITGTFREGNALNLTINTGRLLIQGGAQASVSSLGTGNAGSLIIKASSIELSGTSSDRPAPNEIVGRSLLTTAVGSNSTGKGGNIDITTNTLSVDQGAAISVSNAGREDAGSLKITANSIKLDTEGRLLGTTALRQGGNITLNIADLLLMRHNSQISTTAGTDGAGGNGGNITINAPNGFIVAVPNENSDITANAFEGKGGFIDITAQGVIGLERRVKLTSLSDITAFSEKNPQLNGVIEINTPDVDPNSGLINLPTVPVDTQVAQTCTAGGNQAQSSFIITGRGGLPPNPGESLSTDAVQVDLVTLKPEVDKRSTTAVSTKPTTPTPIRIVQATGWVIDKDGNVTLTANAPNVTPHTSWQKTPDCRAFNQQ